MALMLQIEMSMPLAPPTGLLLRTAGFHEMDLRMGHCAMDAEQAIQRTQSPHPIGDLEITSASNERQKRSQNLAPVLVIISGNSLAFSRKMITSTVFFFCPVLRPWRVSTSSGNKSVSHPEGPNLENKTNLAWSFQFRLKFSVWLANSILTFRSTIKTRPCWGARLKFSFWLEGCKPGGRC